MRPSQKVRDRLTRMTGVGLLRARGSPAPRSPGARATGDTMIKQDIVNATASAAEMAKVKAEKVVAVILDELKSSMLRGERIEIRGFGAFVVKPKKRGSGRNPKTGQVVPILPGRTVRFKPSKALGRLEP